MPLLPISHHFDRDRSLVVPRHTRRHLLPRRTGSLAILTDLMLDIRIRPLNKPYTIASTLTGGEVGLFARKKNRLREIFGDPSAITYNFCDFSK